MNHNGLDQLAQQNAFSEKFDDLIDYFVTHHEITVASIVGVIEIKKIELVMRESKALNDNND